jgi:MEDS: MEthanogen/methylotroph, DcmR Sensory domain
MEPLSRHQCLIYEGPPPRHLLALATRMLEKLQQRHRCVYLNSPPMVAEMRSYLAAAGVDVAHEVGKGSLVLSSDRLDLGDRCFDVDRMMHLVEELFHQALDDGYEGLWGTGDMTWEMGAEQDSSKLLEYERRLEEFCQQHPQFGVICQYHADTLPREMMRQGLLAHRAVFISERLSLLNPYYVRPESLRPESLLPGAADNSKLDRALRRLCRPGSTG